MPDEDFFQRQIAEFEAQRALAVETAGRDEQAERCITTAEYELTQAHRALTAVLACMQAPTAPVKPSQSETIDAPTPAQRGDVAAA